MNHTARITVQHAQGVSIVSMIDPGRGAVVSVALDEEGRRRLIAALRKQGDRNAI